MTVRPARASANCRASSSLSIVGGSRSAAVLRLAAELGVWVWGRVVVVGPLLRVGAVLVVPVWIGRRIPVCRFRGPGGELGRGGVGE